MAATLGSEPVNLNRLNVISRYNLPRNAQVHNFERSNEGLQVRDQWTKKWLQQELCVMYLESGTGKNTDGVTPNGMNPVVVYRITK